MMRRRAHANAALLFLLFAACGGGGDDTAPADDIGPAPDVPATTETGDGPATSETGGTSELPAPPAGCEIQATLSDLEEKYFARACTTSGCHSGRVPAGNLGLEPGDSYAGLVGVDANFPSAGKRVVAGDAEGSFIVAKVTGPAAGHGDFMPPGRTDAFDPACSIAQLRAWIERGAPND